MPPDLLEGIAMSLKSQISKILESGDALASELVGESVLYEGKELASLFVPGSSGVIVELDGVYVELQGSIRIHRKDLGRLKLIPGKKIRIKGREYRLATVEDNPLDVCITGTLTQSGT